MARIGLFLALGLSGVAVAGCAKTSGFTAEASPAAAAIAAPGLDVGAKRAAKDAKRNVGVA